MAQLFSQALIFLGVASSIAGAAGLGIALFQLGVRSRRDSAAQRETRAAGGTALGVVRAALAYLFAAVGHGLLAWVALVAVWVIASNIYNAFVPIYPDCYPTLTNVYACSPSLAVQNDVDQIIQVCAVLYGLYKGFDGLGERSKSPPAPAPPASTPSVTPTSKGGVTI